MLAVAPETSNNAGVHSDLAERFEAVNGDDALVPPAGLRAAGRGGFLS